MKLVILFCITLTFITCRKYDFGQNETVHKVILIESELYVLSNALVNGVNTMHLLKIDTLGRVIYNKVFESSSDEIGSDLIHSSDNTLIIVGSIQN